MEVIVTQLQDRTSVGCPSEHPLQTHPLEAQLWHGCSLGDRGAWGRVWLSEWAFDMVPWVCSSFVYHLAFCGWLLHAFLTMMGCNSLSSLKCLLSGIPHSDAKIANTRRKYLSIEGCDTVMAYGHPVLWRDFCFYLLYLRILFLALTPGGSQPLQF